MKWVTRERPKTDRIACPWLIKNFIDKEAEFLYVPADQVLDVAAREGGHSYDAPGATYTHRDGLCSFEVLLEEYRLDDPALALLARIVHGADVADDGDRLYCACDGGALVVLERDGGDVVASIPLPGVPDVVMHDPVTARLYVSVGDPGVVCCIDMAALETVEVVDTEQGAHTSAWDP